MPKLRKDALDEVVADRLARQAKKSVKQLQAELSHKSSCKVGGLGVKMAVQKVDLSYIPGREVVKENQRAIARRKQMEAEAQQRLTSFRAQRDWTETDEFGNLIVSGKVKVLELNGLKDPSAGGSDGPIYPRGKIIESLHLMGDVEGANSKTFKILEPKRRKQYSESESLRHPLAKGAVRAKEFELTDPELLVKFVNAQTGQVNTAFLHMNSMAISDEEVFTVSRAVPLSSVAKVLDFYGNSVQEATGVLTTERINHGIAKAKCNSLETVSWANNILGPSMMVALSETLVVCRSLHTLDLSNLFEPIADDDGAALMVGLADNRTLQSLNLTGNQLGKNFCWELKQALAKHPKLESLRLDCNEIDDDSCFFIADALVKNTRNQLRTLSLAWNKVDQVGFCRILEAAGTQHSKLRLVNVRNNAISKITSGDVVDALARAKTLERLDISYNRVSDMMPMGLGLYLNTSLLEIDLAENHLSDAAFMWFSFWGADKKTAHLSNLRSLDLRQNRLGDAAAKHIIRGLLLRKEKRPLVRLDLSDNTIDPLLVGAVQALVNTARPYQVCRREAKALVRKKVIQDVGYWKERDWEELQRARKEALDEAVRLLNARTEDEIETDTVVDEPWYAQVPGVRQVAAGATVLRRGVKPVWQLQQELIDNQRSVARKDILFRKALVKGLDKAKK